MKNIIPFLLMAAAIVVANNLFPAETDSKEVKSELQVAPAPTHVAGGYNSGCGLH